MFSFALFMIVLVAVVGALAYKAKSSQRIDNQTERVAKASLMAVGSIVEKRHQERHGEAAPMPPAGWYPPKKGPHRTAS